MTREDLDALELADQDALHERRLQLRAMADDILAAMRDMPQPKTLLDAGRSIRTVASIDRALVQLYSPPRRTRRAPARPASRPLPPEAMQALRKFEHTTRQFHKANAAVAAHERAAAARTPPPPPPAPAPKPFPKPARPPQSAPRPGQAPDPADFVNESPETVAGIVAMTIDTVVRRCAGWTGVWPDGAPFVAGEADWRRHTLTAPVELPAGIAFEAAVRAAMPATLDGCNACTRAAAEIHGKWPGGAPYRDDDPEFWSMSAAVDDPRAGTAGESPGPDCLPPWIVHRGPPPDG